MYSRGSKYFGYLLVAISAICAQHRLHGSYGHSSSSTSAQGNRLCGTYGVYLSDYGRCYRVNEKGPCPNLMTVQTTDERLGLGICYCQQSTLPLIYFKKENKCYDIFEQGPCARGYWLFPREGGGARCERCPGTYYGQFHASGTSQFSVSNTCSRENLNSLCPKGLQAYITESFPYYSCIMPSLGYGPAYGGGTSAVKNECPLGDEPDQYGGCEPQAFF